MSGLGRGVLAVWDEKNVWEDVQGSLEILGGMLGAREVEEMMGWD